MNKKIELLIIDAHRSFIDTKNKGTLIRCVQLRKHSKARENGIASAMPFLSFLPAIKYFGHFQNPNTFVVDIYLLSAVDFAMRIGR